MSLSQQLLSQLKTVAGQTGALLSVADGPRTVRCDAVQCDAMAVTIQLLALETGELAGVAQQQLEAASRDLCSRVNYLLEPISPIEIDAQGCSVQMRSNPPQSDDNGRRYYELMLRRGGSVSLQRYEKLPGAVRTIVPAALTHEVVGRLVDDFSQTVDSI
jgi:hypothetical protein